MFYFQIAVSDAASMVCLEAYRDVVTVAEFVRPGNGRLRSAEESFQSSKGRILPPDTLICGQCPYPSRIQSGAQDLSSFEVGVALGAGRLSVAAFTATNSDAVV